MINTISTFLKYVCCATCKGDLSESAAGLRCEACNKNYKIQEGVPILIDLDHLPEHLQGQIKFFEKEKITDGAYQLEPWQQSYLRRFNENWPNVKGKTIIDCGTGSGYMAVELAKLGANVIACDLTLRSLIRLERVAKELGLEDRLFSVCCTSEELPFKSEMADMFISNAVLEHLPKEREAIAEIKRTMKTPSQLMITVPLAFRFINPLLLPVNYIHDQRIGHLRRYDEDILKRHFSDFQLNRTYYTGHSSKVFKTVANLAFPIFDTKKMEEVDAHLESKKWWASNIMSFFTKNNR